MDRMERERLKTAWVAFHQLNENSAARDELFWAYEELDDLVRDQPDLAWELILEILLQDSSDRTFENLAAGPLEDLLANHGEAFIDRVEAEARLNPQFRDLLGGVWQNSMSDEVWRRVQAVAGPRW